MSEQVMIGMMISTGNIDQAGQTGKAFARACGGEAVLGLQTDDLDRARAPFSQFLDERCAEPWKGVFLWDWRCDDVWRPGASFPRPFYTGQDAFSYGGAFNRLMMLALVAEAPVLVRVDAGTEPKADFAARLIKHLAHLDQFLIVSGKYDKRIALRDEFLDETDRPAFHQLIRQYVGVNPIQQLTGGACFTMQVEYAPPAIPFPGFLPVFGSDDAFYNSIEPSVLLLIRLFQQGTICCGQQLCGVSTFRLVCGSVALRWAECSARAELRGLEGRTTQEHGFCRGPTLLPRSRVSGQIPPVGVC